MQLKFSHYLPIYKFYSKKNCSYIQLHLRYYNNDKNIQKGIYPELFTIKVSKCKGC